MFAHFAIQPVILSGGFGSRLWPLSREDYPKQLISIIDGYSMLQNTLQRLDEIKNKRDPIVICNQAHRFVVAEQLQQIGVKPDTIILEPCGRNTAPAITLAALCAKPDTVLLILPADHVIRNNAALIGAIQQAIPSILQGKFLTFGVAPRLPHTGFGYIQRGERLPEGGFKVAAFVEKPDILTAERYFHAGDYYWNSGMFMFTAESYLKALATFQPDILAACQRALTAAQTDQDFTRIDEAEFKKSPAISIDYAVMEKLKDAVVLPLEAGWSDVGSWTSIWEVGPQDTNGNVLHGDVFSVNVTNSYLRSEDRFLAVVGVDDHVVIETADAVLVAHRNSTEQIRKVVDHLTAMQRKERFHQDKQYGDWGQATLLMKQAGFTIRKLRFNPHARVELQDLNKPAGQWLVLQGEAELMTTEASVVLQKGQSYLLNQTVRTLCNKTAETLLILEIDCKLPL